MAPYKKNIPPGKKKIFILILFLLGFFNCAYCANLPYINKSKIRHSVAPGQQAYGEIILDNNTAEVRPMKLYLEDWYYLASADGAKEFLPAGTTTRSCVPWITFSPSEFTMAPFGRQRVSYSIKVPPAAGGAYYAVLFFECVVGEIGQPTAKRSAGINVTVRIATLFYVEVEGTTRRTAELRNLAFRKDSDTAPLTITADFRNTGNVDITAATSFHIMDKSGIIHARGQFNNVYLFGGDKAQLVAQWKEVIPAGKYDFILTCDIGKAQEETGLSRGPVITKEARIEIGPGGEVVRANELK